MSRKPPKSTKRLDKIAPQVLAAFAANPPAWADEFNVWIANTFGPRPSPITRGAAARQFDAAVLGSVLAFNYLADGSKEESDADAGQSTE